MFWGLIMEPNKRYTQTVDKPFHISQAAMDTSTGDADVCQVMVVVDSKNFLVCTLQKAKVIQVPLDLYFKKGDVISFLTNGKCNVHLTGYLDPEFGESDSEEEDDEEEEEDVPELVPAKNKRKLDTSNDGAVSKKAKPDKKQKKVVADSDSDSSESDDDLQKMLEGEDIDTDENDDSFKINTTVEGSDSENDSDDEAEEEEAVEDEEEDSDEEGDTTLDSSSAKEETPQKLTKSQKRRLKKLKQQEGQTNGVEKPKTKVALDDSAAKAEEPGQKLTKGQKRRLKKQKQGELNGDASPKKEKTEAPQKAGKQEVAKPDAEKPAAKEKKSLTGGVQIEDLKVGSGPAAKAGKVVQVYYEGRLKTNNKMFDNCNKGPGFKFRLGSKEVITGWDVGVAGMKVGGKRKIVCPPAMAYGAKGSPPVIPPNSALVFEVELKNVK